MDLSQYVMGGFMVIGFVNLVDLAYRGQWESFIKGVVGILAGSIAGGFKMFGVPNLEVGILLGISVSGIYKIAQVIGVKPTGQPNV